MSFNSIHTEQDCGTFRARMWWNELCGAKKLRARKFIEENLSAMRLFGSSLKPETLIVFFFWSMNRFPLKLTNELICYNWTKMCRTGHVTRRACKKKNTRNEPQRCLNARNDPQHWISKCQCIMLFINLPNQQNKNNAKQNRTKTQQRSCTTEI